MRRFVVQTLIFMVISAFLVSSALAVPGFSRRYEVSCNQCHNPWPNLNAFGRNFKENGYRLEAGTSAPEHLMKLDERSWLEKWSFLSGKLNGRLYDKTDTNDEWRLRAFHEAELILAGHASNNVSFNVLAEAEDEDDFNLFVEWAAAGWHPRKVANIVAGWGPIFYVDPYNTLTDGSRRLTRSHKAPLDAGFLADAPLRTSTQFVSYFGRARDLYYSATIGTGSDDPEGADAKDLALRVMYDFPVISVGGFYVDGSTTDGLAAGIDQDWTRAGIDFQLEKGGFSAYGVWLRAKDDVLGPPVGDVTNDAAYITVLNLFSKDDRPLWYPLVRWETVESSDGEESTDAVAILVGGFFRQNISLSIEYWKETSVPTGEDKNDRLTLFFNIGI